MLGHHDTVWPVGQLTTMPYLDDGEDDGEVARGPGVFDMKGGLAVFEMAIRALQATGVRPAREVRLVVVADEEVGSPHG